MNIQGLEKKFPKTFKLKDGSLMDVRLMTPEDEKIILEFFKQIPDEDLEYARINIYDPDTFKACWINRLATGKSVTLLGFLENKLIGFAALHQETAKGAEHVGYIRLAVCPQNRGKGVASHLANEIYSIALGSGLEKIYAEIVQNQKTSLELFVNKLGFRSEALLRDHVKDSKGNKYDLIILSSDPVHLSEEIRKRTCMAFMFCSFDD